MVNKVQKLAEAYFAEQENGKISFHRLYKRCNDQIFQDKKTKIIPTVMS
jgi:hypothetical protein